MKSVLHIHLEEFAVTIERARDSALRDRPIVIVLGDPNNQRTRIFAASKEARRAGIYPSHTLSQVRSRLRSAAVVSGQQKIYRKVADDFSHLLHEYSPLIERPNLQQAYVDLTGSEPLFGPAMDTGNRIYKELRNRLGFKATMGLAGNRLVSTVATDVAEPAQFLEIFPGEERPFLAPLDVTHLPGVGEKIQRRLLDFNITTVGELATITPEQLCMVFGKLGLHLHARALGIDHSTIQTTPRISSLHVERQPSVLTNDIYILTRLLDEMCAWLGNRLRQQGFFAKKILLRIFYADGIEAKRQEPLPKPTDLDHELFALTQRLFIQLFLRRSYVSKLGLTVSGLYHGFHSLDLFGEELTATQAYKRYRALDKIRARWGGNALRLGRNLLKAQH